MHTLTTILIISGVIIGIMVIIILLETLTSKTTNELVSSKETSNEQKHIKASTCSTGSCGACSFQLVSTKNKKTKGDETSCNTF